jgi:2-polyprenyl-3-methyl-5-hydroxy-6-metoxy-1,4-benzoquinol methylase
MHPLSPQQNSLSGSASRQPGLRGTPVERETWERQYRSGEWDYLAGEDEAGHYLAIARFCGRYLEHGTLLDIGCGAGILPSHLQAHAGMALARYTGIDLAEEAVRRASLQFPEARFLQFDYNAGSLPGRYDGVIFNETLYCFDDPLAIIDKCIAENTHPGSLLFISMYGDHHEAIWDAVSTRCHTLAEEVVQNTARNVRWKIRVLRPGAQILTAPD